MYMYILTLGVAHHKDILGLSHNRTFSLGHGQSQFVGYVPSLAVASDMYQQFSTGSCVWATSHLARLVKPLPPDVKLKGMCYPSVALPCVKIIVHCVTLVDSMGNTLELQLSSCVFSSWWHCEAQQSEFPQTDQNLL
jgi:hypothetical protein